METSEIERRLRLGEDSATELKSVAHDGFKLPKKLQDELAKEIAAFANSGGGTIFVGVEDDGKPTGVGTVEQADVILRQITQLCQMTVHPPLPCRVTKAEVSGKLLLVVHVDGWTVNRPYRAGHTSYVRHGAESRQATRDELVRLLQSQDVHLDEQPSRLAALDDLDEAAVREFLTAQYGPAAVHDRDHYLRALKCLDDGGQPTVTGVLFFAKDPQRFFPDARVSIVQFRDRDYTGDLSDHKELVGGLVGQLDRATEYLALHAPRPADLGGLVARPTGIPHPVLREAVQNALAHRDYNAASQVRLLLFPDRVEIINPGLLLNRLTLDGIRLGGISQRRNPAIAALLALTNRRLSIGMGVRAMIEHMQKAGLPAPELSLEGGHFKVVLRTSPPEVVS
jgi:ATP-dependent DNA helicase RecG